MSKRRSSRSTAPQTLTAALHQAVREALAAGWSVRSIAREANVPLSTLSAWLSGGRADMKLATADRLCQWLNMRLTKPRTPKVKT